MFARVVLVLALVLTAFPAAAVPGSEAPSFVAVYPNPVTDDDAGEFVVITVPEHTTGNWTLSDGEDTVSLPTENLHGTVALTVHPTHVSTLTDHRILALPRALELANSGEILTLRKNGNRVAQVRYQNAPESERWVRTERGWAWEPLRATDFSSVSVQNTTVTTFVLPDAPNATLETIHSADHRILLAGYTFSSPRITDALIAAKRRGVTVRVLLDREPVGGMTTQQRDALDRLAGAGIPVKLIGGDRARYSFHHAKYAVVDSQALVLTENWKPAGVGGNASRGWGVEVRNATLAAALAETFAADSGWRDTTSWAEARKTREFVAAPPANGSYLSRFAPTDIRAERVELLVTPDNAETKLVAHIDNATDSLRVEQVTIGSRDHALLRATLRAAERGVDVRILLSGAWYVREENRELARWLNQRATANRLSLEARVAEPRGRFEKIHAKGAIIDGNTVVLGSLNWNDHALRENREVVVVLHGTDVGAYYVDVFDADWRGGAWHLSVGLGVVVALSALGAGAAGRKIRFEA
ncbi:phospholipase D-like domain-containing protein [Haladaptatus sp. DJG-WS-42]|uniref:phospholipase D-like domain-containing protein n=1 Tax=Haladaptatus sp. DJG-WS-42 TaxID=3120516 RepID=UPI0030D1D746